MSEELKAALARIACLEGEIAKRDEELAACRIAVENCDLFRARIAELEQDLAYFPSTVRLLAETVTEREAEINQLRAELAAIKEQEPVEYQLRALIRDVTNIPEAGYYMPQSWHDQVIALSLSGKLYAPVSEAKAQGVVMPERWNVPRPMWKDARQPYGNPLNHADIEAAEKFNLALDEVARLNAAPCQHSRQHWNFTGGGHCDDCGAPIGTSVAAPAQQVSVPASAFASRAITHYEAALLAAFPSGSSGEVFNQWNEARRVLAAAHVSSGDPEKCSYQDDPRSPAELSLAGCNCVRFGEYNPHWPCKLHTPAADAGCVLEQAMYTLISIGYHENSGLVHELRQALAASRAKGVV